jgi:hypothetical protein
LVVRLVLPLCWGGWLLSVGCVRLPSCSTPSLGVWAQLPCCFWSGCWAPPEMLLCGVSMIWCEVIALGPRRSGLLGCCMRGQPERVCPSHLPQKNIFAGGGLAVCSSQSSGLSQRLTSGESPRMSCCGSPLLVCWAADDPVAHRGLGQSRSKSFLQFMLLI